MKRRHLELPFHGNLALPKRKTFAPADGLEGSGSSSSLWKRGIPADARLPSPRPHPERLDETRRRQVFWLSDRSTGRAFSSLHARMAVAAFVPDYSGGTAVDSHHLPFVSQRRRPAPSTIQFSNLDLQRSRPEGILTASRPPVKRLNRAWLWPFLGACRSVPSAASPASAGATGFSRGEWREPRAFICVQAGRRPEVCRGYSSLCSRE